MKAFIAATIIAGTTLAAEAPRMTYSDRYGVLSDRNIFLKDRSHPSTRPSSTQPTHTDPEQSFVLRGIVIEDGYRAYVENINTNEMLRLAVGDAIARGRVVGIDINSIAYERPDGRRVLIEIGNDLTGATPPPPGEFAASTTQPVMPSGVDNLNPNDPNLTAEQRMKLRRMQELKGK